tara:strand:+ start:1689 stop:2459 length:771 start_codon:yes stop_codon:yes gene_type:complete
MNRLDKKSKRKGLIGTILFHSFLLASFMFIGLSFQDPPPPEEGISINLSFIDEGSGEIEPEDTEKLTSTVEQEIINEQIESADEVLTQSTIEATLLEKKEVNKTITEEEPTKEDVKEKEPQVNKKALYSGKKKNNSSLGRKKEEGVQGTSNGDPNSVVYEGSGISSNGDAYQLGGRKAINKPKPKGNQIEGRVVVMITVDRLGNVIYANAGVKGSTTLNKDLLKRARVAALATKFDIKQSAPNNQYGKIVYDFKLN